MLMKARDLIQISMVNNNRPTSKKIMTYLIQHCELLIIVKKNPNIHILENRIQAAYGIVLKCH